MNVIVANFGNDSIGLIQYARELGLSDVYVVSIETGWGNPLWDKRVEAAQDWVKSLQFSWVRLQPKLDFANLIRAQGEFPSTKFQWCATYLKGDTIRHYLQEQDPLKEATVLLARRRSQSSKFQDLAEFIEGSEDFAERKIWHPLVDCDAQTLQNLVKKTPFDWLAHRSLECDPCVNSDATDVLRLTPDLIKRLAQLEIEMKEPFLPHLCHDKNTLQEALPSLETGEPRFLFDMGCGSPYGCGL